MRRRAFLAGLATAGAASLSGCAGLLETRSVGGEPPVPDPRPGGVYLPSHVEGMAMADTGSAGEYAFGLMYSYPHRFWTVTGDAAARTDVADEDDLHLMAAVWDPETGVVLPDTGLSVEITREGSLVSQETIYPMLSQPMGFHHGANFGLDGEGDYAVRLSVGGTTTRRTGAFAGRFGEPAAADLSLEFSESTLSNLRYERLDERAGRAGAVDPTPMEMVPSAVAPDDLPGRTVGEAESDDAVLVATVLDEPPEGIDAQGRYLAVSARTRYNRMLIPAMGLTGALRRDGETVFEGELVRTIDPDLRYHYGAVVDEVRSGDELALSVTTPPQTARHEGYETAFGGVDGAMPDATITVE